ncbi:MAG: hypothetical protein QW594_00925, partial [Candidatus Woesearchaeota archaeon]
MEKRTWIILGLVLFFSILVRILLLGSSFSDDSSYFHLRLIERIAEERKLSFTDPLSYGGRAYPYPPFFYTLLAVLFLIAKPAVLFFPLLVVGLFPLVIFFLSLHITRSEPASLLSAAAAGTLPIFLVSSVNLLSPLHIAMPLFFLCLYFFIRIRLDNAFLYAYLVSFIALTLTSPFVFLFVLLLFVYLVLLRLEEKRIAKKEFELFLFSLFFPSWFYLLLYKDVLFAQGLGILLRNVPPSLLLSHFQGFSLLTFLAALGIVVFVVGFYMLYKIIFSYKDKDLLLLVAGSTVLLVGMAATLLTLFEGLFFLAGFFSLLVGVFFAKSSSYLEALKIARYKWFLGVFFVLALLLTNLLPAGYFL